MDDIARLPHLTSNGYSSERWQIGLHRAFATKQHVDGPSEVPLSGERSFVFVNREHWMREIDHSFARNGCIEAGGLRLRRRMLVAAEVLRCSIEIGVKHLT